MFKFAKKRLSKFLGDIEGSMTVLGLYMFLVGSMIGAIALDYNYLSATKVQLQVAADQAAHAAIYNRRTMSEEDAKKAAIELIQPLLPKSKYGQVIKPSDIEFGSYDRDTSTFTADPGSKSAVRVKTSLLDEKTNAAPSFLFRMIGIDTFDIAASTTFMVYKPGCLKEGIMADGVVDMQSDNTFSNGFCIHSNSYVSLNQNNYFEPGTVVSMPNIDDLDIPKSGFKKNEGLEQAIREQRMHLNVLNRMKEIYDGLDSGYGDYIPSYITSPSVQYLSESNITPEMLESGNIYRISCLGARLNIDGSVDAIKDVVIITQCPVSFANDSKLFNAVIVTTDTSIDSIRAPQGLQIGQNDGCATGGGAQILTMGGVSVAAKLSMFGGQILAQNDIDFAANADGLEGASIVTRGKINGTSNSKMGFCLSGMEQNFEADYYRMAE